MKRDGPKARNAVHGTFKIKYHPKEKANAIAYCLENTFTPRNQCDGNHERRLEVVVQALLETVDDTRLEK
jgi:hypothetical protein